MPTVQIIIDVFPLFVWIFLPYIHVQSDYNKTYFFLPNKHNDFFTNFIKEICRENSAEQLT